MSEGPTIQVTHFLRTEAVKWAIAELRASKVHSSFLLYLILRRSAVESGSSQNLTVDLFEIRSLLALPGGPANKPLFRPLSLDNVRSVANFWITDHLAGSYALSSLRSASRWMASADGTSYALPDDHVQQAKNTFLAGGSVSALALATFLLRDFGFDLLCEEGHPEDVVAAFRSAFSFYDAHDKQFEQLFSDDLTASGVTFFERVEGEFLHA